MPVRWRARNEPDDEAMQTMFREGLRGYWGDAEHVSPGVERVLRRCVARGCPDGMCHGRGVYWASLDEN